MKRSVIVIGGIVSIVLVTLIFFIFPVKTKLDTYRIYDTPFSDNNDYNNNNEIIIHPDKKIDNHEIVVSKSQISGFEDLLSYLRQFPEAAVIDLRDYEFSKDEYERLRTEFPAADIKCKVYLTLSGKKVYTGDTEIDISGIEADTEELRAVLYYLPEIVRVKSDGVIDIETKEKLVEEFPNVSFDVKGVYEICGKQVQEDAEEIDLSGAEVDANALVAGLKRVQNLKKVTLYDVNIGTAEQNLLVNEFPDINFLWKVTILGEQYDSTVTDLDLSGKKELTADMARQIIPLLKDLKRIDLSDCASSNEELAVLREEFPDVKIVWKLYLGKWSLKTDSIAFSVLIYDYTHRRMTSKDIEVLKYCTDLQALDLGHQAITDISVIGDYLKELRILILVDNKVSDLTPIAQLKHLHYLELFVNPISDLTPIGECKEMVDLNISYLSKVKDFSALYDFPLLERLFMEHMSLTAADKELFKKTYPNTYIVTVGTGSVDQGWRTHARYYAMIKMYKDRYFMSEEFSKYDNMAP